MGLGVFDVDMEEKLTVARSVSEDRALVCGLHPGSLTQMRKALLRKFRQPGP